MRTCNLALLGASIGMSRQDKATTERNARTLRELVKQPDNKACADCRKNDARWASWNLGVFLCIRCSGIHRSMGTHISKVKSIDLDIWQPEQMESMQKWGNRRANMYWEKHLKAGHIPPEHKIESFIRSKYESKRWAMEGPLPHDPSVLDGHNGAPEVPLDSRPSPTATTTAPPAAPASLPRAHPLLYRTPKAQPTAAAARPGPAAAPTPAPLFDLMGSDEVPTLAPAVSPAPTAAPAAAAQSAPLATAASALPAATAAAPPSNIFDLDFRAPTSPPAKMANSKADIMSLFSTPSPSTATPSSSFFAPPAPPADAAGPNIAGNSPFATASAPAASPYASWSGGVTSTVPPQPSAQLQAPIWGLNAEQAAWGGAANAAAQPAAGGIGTWGGTSADPWANSSNTSDGMQQKKEDPFANIWQ